MLIVYLIIYSRLVKRVTFFRNLHQIKICFAEKQCYILVSLSRRSRYMSCDLLIYMQLNSALSYIKTTFFLSTFFQHSFGSILKQHSIKTTILSKQHLMKVITTLIRHFPHCTFTTPIVT